MNNSMHSLILWQLYKTGLKVPTASALRDWHLARLGEIAEYAYENSSFYHSHLGTAIGSGHNALPFTDSSLLAAHGSGMLCQSLDDVARIRSFSTSGSTGLPKRIYFGEQDLADTVDFFANGMECIADHRRPTLILMSDSKPNSIADLLKQGLALKGMDAVIHGRPHNLSSLIRAVRESGTLVALPADIFYLCKKAPQLRPASVLLSADYISPSLVKSIETIWHCPVYAHYGLTETCYGLAVDTPARDGMHLRHDRFYLEIIDPDSGQVLPPGAVGEIVLTTLQPNPMPLIRYRTGDIGQLTADSGLFRLARVYGRRKHLSAPVNIHRLDDLLYARSEVDAYEARLYPDHLELLINGTAIDDMELTHTLNRPVTVRYTENAPWDTTGKRSLSLAGE